MRPVLWFILPTSKHQLIHFVWSGVWGWHPVARVNQFPCPGVCHPLVGSPSLGEDLPGQHSVTPNIT